VQVIEELFNIQFQIMKVSMKQLQEQIRLSLAHCFQADV